MSEEEEIKRFFQHGIGSRLVKIKDGMVYCFGSVDPVKPEKDYWKVICSVEKAKERIEWIGKEADK